MTYFNCLLLATVSVLSVACAYAALKCHHAKAVLYTGETTLPQNMQGARAWLRVRVCVCWCGRESDKVLRGRVTQSLLECMTAMFLWLYA